MRFSIPYSNSNSSEAPVWGPITSPLKYVVPDYVVTVYIAEFINALTSLIYLGYAFHRLHSVSTYAEAFTTALPYVGLAYVGICSAAYHTLLKAPAELADELSMHFATACVLHRIFSFDQPPRIALRNGIVLLSILIGFVGTQSIKQDFLWHALLWASMLAAIGWKTRNVVQKNFKKGDPAKRRATKVARLGGVYFGVGYAIWNLDWLFCSQLTSLKRQWGMPWSFLLEFHGWWHLLTAMGAYSFMALVELLVDQNKPKQERGQPFAWPVSLYLSH
ncbi:hypothetical protein P152DRAFT_429878 [Eremomyces bilateralis CBS 781.70]|uniref:Alkaline phytoceramidase n=1 Tax=Eremomyces bilateralis CBS 781.70 TaxID=1392243 RepID=A0A6G1GCM5_9PEZI|nr:uncharacterized protein P152DRAFT_429878 [Eremomyces bilateralis CBS 781.70]KAF1815666.1 hypothetical protein P152DRAFT_429878 [Eremomyces bilateralis CBS 781.70]